MRKDRGELLKRWPKAFAIAVEVDAGAGKVELWVEGKDQPSTWPVSADAEIKIDASWGRLAQVHSGDRVWAWFELDRRDQPLHVVVLADELSEQDIHGSPHTLEAVDVASRRVIVRRAGSEPRDLELHESIAVAERGGAFHFSTLPSSGGEQPDLACGLGQEVYVQTGREGVRLILTARELDARRDRQRSVLDGIWEQEGVPATVTVLHPLTAEMELMVDHEGLQWIRQVAPGTMVELHAENPIPAIVESVAPWRERTRLMLTTMGQDQSELRVGQRLPVRLPAPRADRHVFPWPADPARLATKEERIDWILAGIYCTCDIQDDSCTGMFYTLASCEAMKCGMPKRVRSFLATLIDDGKANADILRAIVEEYGSLALKPHILK